MKRAKRIGPVDVLIAMSLAMSLAGCDSSNQEQLGSRLFVANNDISSIEVTSPSEVIQVDGSRALTLTDSTGVVVTDSALWSSSDTTILTVSQTGVVTGVADGSATITAVLGPLSSTIELSASSAPLQTITIDGGTAVSAEGSIDECTNVSFTALGDYADGGDPRSVTDLVTWSLSAGSIGTVDSSGLLRSNSAGVGTVQAVLDGITGTLELTVLNNVSAIEITDDGGTLSTQNPVQYTATASYTDNTNSVEVTNNADWLLDASFASVSTDAPGKGLVTATSTGGEATLTASCGGESGTLSISSGSATLITGLSFNLTSPRQTTFEREETIALAAFVDFENDSQLDVTDDAVWSVVSSDNNLITLSTVGNSKGEVTISGPGELVLQVSYVDENDDPPQTYTARFTVISNPP